MGIWDDWFGQNPSITPPSQEQVNAAMIQNLRDRQRFDPEGYWLAYGTKTPEQALYAGESSATFERDPLTGQILYDEAGNAKRRLTGLTAEERARMQSDIAALNAANAPPPPEQAPPPPPPPPEQGPPPYGGPSARQKLESLLPPGFDVSVLPDAFTAPFVESTRAAGRTRAEDFIGNMLRRGTITEGGAGTARGALSSQDPAVRERLAGVANALLAGGRSRLRGIAGEGYAAAAAPGETGEFFNPAPYQQRVSSEAAGFTSGFPTSFAGEVGDVGGLYNVAGLPSAGGAVTGPQNVQYDPYAFEGGKLPSTGGGAPQKKRTTSVF